LPRSHKYLILVVGPTAVGKTALCLKIAKKFDTEIISCDSRQFYKELNIGTAKPSEEELKAVTHHLVGHKSIFEGYDIKAFENDALAVLEKIYMKSQVAVMTGGSGLFANIICEGMDEIPEIDPKVREMVIGWYKEKGLTYLQLLLKDKDPDFYAQVDMNNPQRLMRALEVFFGTGKPFSAFRKKKKVKRPFEIIKIGLFRDRKELYERIDQRMDVMIQSGLFEEASLFFPHKDLNALQTVGYSEIFGFMEGNYDRIETIRLLKRNSRRYAKRQMTWFRKDPEIHWFQPHQEVEILEFLERKISLPKS
jgi:tRNA dimethylallyltransferase